MKRLIFFALVLLSLAGCRSAASNASLDTPAYNPFIEAFTSGRVPRGAGVFVIFTQPVDEALRTPEALSKAMSLKPSASGRWEWQDERTAVFRPEGEMRRDTRYTVSADVDELFGATGDHKRFSFAFETLPLALYASQPRFSAPDISGGEQYEISIEMTSPDAETPETVEKMVTLSEPATVEWTHGEGGTSHTMLLSGVQAADAPRNIVVTSNGEELASVYIPAKTEFGVYGVTYVSHPEKYIEVTFTKALDAGQNMNGLAYIASNNSTIVNVEDNRLRLYPEGNAARTVEVILSSAIRSADGTTLGEDTIRTVEVSGEVPAFRFVGEGVIIPRSRELSIPFEAVWLRGVTVSVTRIYEKNAGQFLQINDLDGADELMRVGRLVARKTVWLDEQGTAPENWKTYAIDLRKLIEPEPGAIYRVELSMSRDLSAFPCDGAEPQKTKAEIAARDEAAFRNRLANYDGGYYYYYDDDIDWGRYNYREREDPCAYSFYAGKQIARNVMATDLGLVVKSSQTGEMIAVVNDLPSAKPVAGVRVEACNFQGQSVASAVTDAAGMARLNVGTARPWYVTASHETQRTWLRVNEGSELSTSSFDVSGEAVRRGIKGFIYGDRGVWRPGDTMYLSFMLNDRTATLPPNVPVVAELYDPMGQLQLRKTATKGEMGLYSFEMPTEPDARTGAWRVQVDVGGVSFSKRVRVETVKPNRLKIDFGFGARKTILASEGAEADLHVEWLTGAVARSLRYETDVTLRPVATRFDGFDGFVFDDPAKNFSSRDERIAEGRVDAAGDAAVKVSLDVGESAPGMLAAGFTTRVYEESGDFSIDGLSVGYSPYERYVGVRSPQTGFGQLDTGADHRFSVAMVNYEGSRLVDQTVAITVYKVEWHWWWDSSGGNLANYVANSYNRPVQTFEVKTGLDGRANFTLNKSDDEWGTYYIRAGDTAGRHTTGIMAYFDWPGSWRRGAEGGEGATELKFTTDKDTYAPGETIQVRLPSSPGARAIVSVENGTGVVAVSSHECTGTETVVPIPVTAAMQPNVYVNVTLIQPHGATLNDVPIRLYGIVPVTVSSPESHLTPVIKAPAEIKPEARYEITVSEQRGRPMAYTLAIVDEGLLDLTRFATPDPWAAFNAREALGVSTFDMYNYVLGAYGGRIESLFSIGGDDEAGENNPASVNRFKPVVRFEGPFTLAKGEKRRHSYTMDNYNGRVRVMVVAGDGSAYGSASQSVMVRKPVMLLGTLPRVIGTGEEMDVPATVFATEDGVGNVEVSIATSEGMTVVGAKSQTVRFGDTGDKTVTFRVRTSPKSGAGRVTLTASGKGDTSVWETDMEIRSVRRERTKVTQATVEADKTWDGEIEMPGADGTNSLTLEVSSIPPVNLAARLRYLLGYPHGCLEQITSKSFPQLYLATFAELSAAQRSGSDAAVNETVRRYSSYRTAEGAFAYWPGGTSTDAYTSVYAMHFMLEAEARAYLIPAALKRAVLANLTLVARNWRHTAAGSYYIGSEQYTQAYRLYVLALAGRAETGAMNRLREESGLTTPSRWMLAAAYAQSGRKDVAAELISAVAPVAADYTSGYDLTYGSNLRDRAVRLMVLAMLDRAADAAELCREISAELSSDSWLSTQSTAWALMSVSRYAEKYAMDSRARFSYEAADKKGNVNSDKSVWTLPVTEKAAAGRIGTKIVNRGNGTLFVRTLATGTPDQGVEEAYSMGVVLDVKWVDGSGRTVKVDSLAKGTALTAVVTVSNPTPKMMRNLVLTQVFPAGWEILSTRFMEDAVFTGATGSTTDDTPAGVSYQDIRDDRVYSYLDRLPAGRSVTVRLNLAATYGGRFYLPPVWCEAMYDNLIGAGTEGGAATVY